MDYEQSPIDLARKVGKWVLPGILFLLLGLGSCGTVNYGERGVLLRFGAVTGNVKDEGLYFKIPSVDHVEILDIKTKKSEIDADASTKDLQMVTSKVALNYHINPMGIAQFFQKFPQRQNSVGFSQAQPIGMPQAEVIGSGPPR